MLNIKILIYLKTNIKQKLKQMKKVWYNSYGDKLI